MRNSTSGDEASQSGFVGGIPGRASRCHRSTKDSLGEHPGTRSQKGLQPRFRVKQRPAGMAPKSATASRSGHNAMTWSCFLFTHRCCTPRSYPTPGSAAPHAEWKLVLDGDSEGERARVQYRTDEGARLDADCIPSANDADESCWALRSHPIHRLGKVTSEAIGEDPGVIGLLFPNAKRDAAVLKLGECHPKTDWDLGVSGCKINDL